MPHFVRAASEPVTEHPQTIPCDDAHSVQQALSIILAKLRSSRIPTTQTGKCSTPCKSPASTSPKDLKNEEFSRNRNGMRNLQISTIPNLHKSIYFAAKIYPGGGGHLSLCQQ